MKLVYLYIKEYGILKDVEFNFDLNYKFHYNKDTQHLEDKSEELTSELDDNFFSVDPQKNVVTSVSALVGNNGAGKTTLARFIHKINDIDALQSECIYIYKKDGELYGISNMLREITQEDADSIIKLVDEYMSLTNPKKNEFARDNFAQSPPNFSPHYKEYLNMKGGSLNKFKSDLLLVLKDEKRLEYAIQSIFENFKDNTKLKNKNDEDKIKLKYGNCIVISYASRNTSSIGSFGLSNVRGLGNSSQFKFVYLSQHYTPMHHALEETNSTNPRKSEFANTSADKDLSTSCMFYKDQKAYYNNEDNKQNKKNVLECHESSELIRNINFIADFKEKQDSLDIKSSSYRFLSEIPVSRAIEFKVDYKDFDCLCNQQTIKSEFVNEALTVISEIEKFHHSGGDLYNFNNADFFTRLLIGYWSNYLRSYPPESSLIIEDMNNDILQCLSNIKEELKKSEYSYEKIISCFDIVKANYIHQYNDGDEEKPVNYPNDNHKRAIELFIILGKHLHSDEENKGRGNIFIDIKENKKFILEFVKNYNEVKQITDFVEYDFWPYISSGEFSQLNMYSRLYDCLKNDKTDLPIVLFLDEVEITLHPEIQRKLVKHLIIFFESFFPDKKVHLIFGTHSPILLSDIPKSNVTFLKREDGKVTAQDIAMDNTFGANIHSLYRESFFMENGSMGEFATDKINTIISELNSDNFDYNELEQQINLIGEPVIRNTLMKQLHAKSDISKKIAYHEKQLEQLKRSQGANNAKN